MDSEKKFVIPKVPKKHVVKTPVVKSEPLSWSDLRDPEEKEQKKRDDIKRERRPSSSSSSSETPETEEDYLKLMEKKSTISIERTERKGEWLTKEWIHMCRILLKFSQRFEALVIVSQAILSILA